MLLAIDIGNTNIKLGIFDSGALVEELKIASDKELTAQEYEVLLKTLLKNFDISGCIVSSVVDELNLKIKNAVISAFKLEPIFLTSDINTKVKIKLKNPKEAGGDRIANATGAYILYKKPVIVVDFGTAISFDIVNKDGEFIGGLIAPGIKLQINALNKFTSKLPRVEFAKSKNPIGDNTHDAILSGIVRGTSCMIEGMIKQCETQLGTKATVVATGGYASFIEEYMGRKFDFINPTLTLEGLRYLYELNKN